MNKIYISGKITGCKNHYEKFAKAAAFACKKYNCAVFNPADINNKTYGIYHVANCLHKTKKEIWNYYMKICIKELIKCDKIYMMKNWKRSKGAKLEHKIAQIFGLEIIYE